LSVNAFRLIVFLVGISENMAEHKVDVFISGAGPVGLLITLQLARLGVTTHIIDAADKASPRFPMIGRASTLAPRTSEMLDQLSLFDDMAQIGLLSRRSTTWKDGKRVQGRGWRGVESIKDSFFDFMINIRLKYSEDVFRAKIAELGCRVEAPVKLVDFVLDENSKEEHKVTATCQRPDGSTYRVKAKYIVGADGGGSAVRKIAGIPMEGGKKPLGITPIQLMAGHISMHRIED
jgi:phenol 2-monooxygenase (NADPH)